MTINQDLQTRQSIMRQMYADSMANIALDLGVSKQTVWLAGKRKLRLDPDKVWEILRRKLNYRIMKQRMEPYRLAILAKKHSTSVVRLCRLQQENCHEMETN